ncbi:MAG: DUF3817 domain-containing protein [Candidatus Sericytochromatia bacterium]|nr:DUF3817 domain-containing protein [Candidatus Sericytochromatia bacterium]
MKLFGTPGARLRFMNLLEGLSFHGLLLIAMPLKYLYGHPEYVRVVGMAHGVLFVALAVAALDVARTSRWPLWRVPVLLFVASLPLGSFWLDRRWLRREAVETSGPA